MVLVLSIFNVWSIRHVYFVLAFPCSNIKFDMYMEISQGIKTKGGISTTHVLKLLKNLYGQRQVSRVCNKHLTKILEEI